MVRPILMGLLLGSLESGYEMCRYGWVALEHFVFDNDKMANRKNTGTAIVVRLDFTLIGPKSGHDFVDARDVGPAI